MNRVKLSEKKLKELFDNDKTETEVTDTDIYNILTRFIYGEVYFQGELTDKQRELIILAVATTNQTLNELNEHVKAALSIDVTPIEIKEAIYQCAPYIGFSKTLEALNKVNDVFKEKNIELPEESQSTTTEETRLEKGIEVQQKIFGAEHINAMRANAPENLKHIQEYLSAMCFGDFYTRSGLNLKTRELLTFCIISTLGGCENQVKAHVQGNLNVGNDKDLLINAITQCMPFIGFPRTLNALSCINEIAIDEPTKLYFD